MTARAAATLTLALAILPLAALPSHAEDWREIKVTASPVSFTPHADDIGASYGELTFEGGLVLASRQAFFGGFSGLALKENGTVATLLSDEGWLVKLDLETAQHTLRGVNGGLMAPLTGMDGEALDDKANKDAEAFSLTGDGAFALVGFERTPRLWRYRVAEDGLLVKPEALPLPSAVRRAPFNQGIEAVEALKAGDHAGKTLILLEQPLERIGRPQGWLVDGQHDEAFAVPLTAPYAITDVAEDSRGRIYVLERRFAPFTGPRMRIRRFDLNHLLAGYGVGEVLLEAGLEKLVDNFEGIAIHETSRKIYLTVLSDDNFNALQRTLLMRFSLPK